MPRVFEVDSPAAGQAGDFLTSFNHCNKIFSVRYKYFWSGVRVPRLRRDCAQAVPHQAGPPLPSVLAGQDGAVSRDTNYGYLDNIILVMNLSFFCCLTGTEVIMHEQYEQ